MIPSVGAVGDVGEEVFVPGVAKLGGEQGEFPCELQCSSPKPYIYIYTRIFGLRFAPPRFFRLTFWPRFYHSQNYKIYQLEKKKHLRALGPASCTEFQCASCWHSHLIRSAIFGTKIPGGLRALKITRSTKHVLKSRGTLFLRSPKRRRQLRHSHGVVWGGARTP